MRAPLALLCVSLAVVAGCGGKHAPPAKTTTSPAAVRAAQLKAIVRAWSLRLNAGDNTGAARLFALPAIVIQSPYAFRFRTRSEVALWDSTLPCAGHIVSITVRGLTATAVFKLGNRSTSKCDAPGQLAAAKFTFARGKIVRWEQVAVPATAAPPAA
jgi:hypothetical protein